MNDDELRQLWQQQPLRDPALSPAQVMPAMQTKTTQLRRSLLARDARELLACVIVGVVFASYFFIYRAPVSRLGSLLTVAGALFIAWKLLHARRSTPVAKADATIVEALRAELRAVRAQSQLLRSVGWWYLLPLALGTLLFVWGSPAASLVFKLGFTLGTLVLDAFLYRLNQRAVSQQLRPLETQLEALLHSAETGEPLEAAHLARLRPIALSLAAAQEVKPVEFRVSFWQIALWGELGFIGIWFFLMLSLALDEPGGKRGEPVPPPAAQSLGAETTNRYSLVARKLMERFNHGDYAGVQKLYSPEMSQAFPPQETAAFYTRLAAGLGKLEQLEGPTGGGYRGWTAFRLRGQHGELTMSLALDANDEIAGIYFQPAHEAFGNIQALIPRIFRAGRLVWLVPFVLGGLVFSWLLQKTTERAVGVSALGVHLHRGLKLVLWEDIQEVRTLRVLHLRSLWLLADSGEKTLMPWTSLERPAELKAAVERFAPAHHPLRKYLSLLRVR